MDAQAELRKQINVIHSDLARRGVSSPAIENATYSIETLCKAYMEPLSTYDWDALGLTKTERHIAEFLHNHLGRTSTRDAILEVIFCDDGFRLDHITEPRKYLDVFVCKIRRKLGSSPYWIETTRDVGFRMVLKPCALTSQALQELQTH